LLLRFGLRQDGNTTWRWCAPRMHRLCACGAFVSMWLPPLGKRRAKPRRGLLRQAR